MFQKFFGVFRAQSTKNMTQRMDEEMQFHLDMAAARNAEHGMPPAEAHRAAYAAFGGRERFREYTRDEFRSRLVDDMAKDVLFTLRTMRRRPSVALIVTFTLALGIGAFTTVFSVVNGVLLKPLPYAAPDRLVTVWQNWTRRPPGPHSISPAEYFDYVDQQRSFDAFGVYTFGTSTVMGDGEPVQVSRASVSAGVFDALGVQPVRGKLFTTAQDQPGTNDVVVISDGLWRSRYGGDTAVIGRRINVNGAPVTVVGVLPPDFRLPDQVSSPNPAQLFAPLALARNEVTIRGSHYLSSVARLHRGTTNEQATADIGAIVQRFMEKWPADYPKGQPFGAASVPLQASVVGTSRSPLLLLLGAVFLILLVACVNAASLLLARADSRRDEIAVRTAMGARRSRLVRQLLVESTVLAVFAGAAGVALSFAAVHAFVQWHPVALPRLAELTIDGRVLGFALFVTMASALGFGVAPALQLVQSDVHLAIRSAGRGATAGARRRQIRRVLVAGEIAITVVLLLGAALLTKSLVNLLGVDPGFRVDHVMTVALAPPRGVYNSDEKIIGLYEQVAQRVHTLPGVRAAGAVAGVPLVAPRGDMGIEFEGHPIPAGQPHPQIDWQVVTPGYFDAIGMRMLAGREIEPMDRAGTTGVAVVNATMAKRYWPAGDAIGHRFKLGGGAKPDTATVVGIVADVHQAGLGQTPDPEMYLAHAQFRFWGGGGILDAQTLVVRTDGEPTSVAAAIRSAIRDVAPDVPIGTFRTMEEQRSASVAQPRFAMIFLVGAAVIAFVISIVGLYGLIAYSVAQRRKEFGVRLALGAQRADIARMVMKESVVITAAGIAVGLPAAVLCGRLLESFLFEARASDPALLILVSGLLTAVSLLAAYVPARRAARADPVKALRTD